MKLFALVVALALALAAASIDAQAVAPGAKKPCLESGGVAINLNGNFGFCYLKGRRMRPGSVFAQCSDGALKCFEDEGIPDKPRKTTPCIAPEPGFCGSDKDATRTPTPTPSATNATASGNGTRSYEVGDDDDEEEKEEEEETRSMKKPKVNPSALVAGNLANGETYDDDDDDDAVYR